MTIPGIYRKASCIREPFRRSAELRRLSVEDIQSLRHTVRDCKYHVVWILNTGKRCLRKAQEGNQGPLPPTGATEGERGAGGETGSGLRPRVALGSPKVCRCPGGRLYQREERDYIARISGRKQLRSQSFWARGYCVSTIGWTSKRYERHPSPGRDRSKNRPDESV